ncbi:cytochrome c biogenesis protein ResB [Klenkia sp. LSe6-5]|uniref:Cytochrome c biogenesis protein ResB n=1 Tax=Klenkia sesuvii TaxID=3103137 RepID=A0ABU8DPZ1_9ACTN
MQKVSSTLLRWWRSLTAMRTALVLLFLLAVAAIPGSLLPQRSLSQSQVSGYFAEHPDLAPVLDKLYLFDVFSSPWFAAIYLLLFLSLIGCVLPRAVEHARAVVAAPPPAPRHLHRLPDNRALDTPLPATEALDAVEEELRVRRFRVVRRDGAHGPELSAEKGFLKETGNVVFHLALLALLLGLAGGKLWGYEGSILVTEGDRFCNTFQQYDNHSEGALVDTADMTPLCVTLEDFRAEYEDNLTAASFTADISYGLAGSASRATTIGVNDPLRFEGDRVYVTGHGFSPVFSVTFPNGDSFTDVSAPFLPSDTATMSSQGALKLPDVPGSDEQLALEGFFAPTGSMQGGVLTSIDPRPLDPQVALFVYEGYLGLDSGIPQNVYSVDQTQIDRGTLERVGAANLSVGESTTLADGTVITFSGLKQFAAMQVSHDPGQLWVLVSAIAILVGLLGMLLLRRERVFARAGAARGGGAGTVLAIGALTRGSADTAPRFTALTDDVAAALARRARTEENPSS